jgi:phosphotriesterase-related protein
MPDLITTLGPKHAGELGLVLPHEHVLVDLRTPAQLRHVAVRVDPADVCALMAPYLHAAAAMGVTALVECSPVGVGRRADILRAVSLETQMPLVVPTGIYREPWIPAWAHAAGESDLYDWMLGELCGEIEQSGVQAGFVKLSAGDDGLTPGETKILRAAGRAAARAGAAIASHTIRGRVVADQLAILAQTGFDPARFIWVHASAEPDFALNLELAHQGIWIEYDWIGGVDDGAIIERVCRMLDAGLGDRILLSQDRGWYDPAQPGGGTPKPYTHLPEVFLPALAAHGVSAPVIQQLTRENPFRAFAR